MCRRLLEVNAKADFWRLEEHKLGETSFTHFADGSAHKNRMQGNDFVQSLMYALGVTCFSCHDPHGTENQAILREAGNAMCLTCPRPQDTEWAACRQHRAAHAPRGRQRLRGLSYADNCRDSRRRESPQPYISFRLAGADRNAEDSKRVHLCHTDKATAWAMAALRGWNDRSPWRSQ
jgi:predicted CXXCH cytochrome family protein